MRKRLLIIGALLIVMVITVNAQLHQGHFFKILDNENVAIEHAEKYFKQWFSLPEGTQWKKVSHSTDNLGMTRTEYCQYVDGVEVEHSQVLLHGKNGKVTVANGAVLELQQTPQRSSKVRRAMQSASKGNQEGNVCLIETDNGYSYASKTLSADRKAWVYTDVETGDTLKRLPRARYVEKPTGTAAEALGKSLYSGNVTLDVTKSADGKTWLYDQKRNIHTMLGAYLPTPNQMKAAGTYDKYSKEVMDKNLTNYLLDGNNSSYIGTDGSTYGGYKLNKLKFTKLASEDVEGGMQDASEDFDMEIVIRYGMDTPEKKSVGSIENMTTKIIVKQMPFEIDLSKYQRPIPREGVTISFEGEQIENTTISFKPDASGKYIIDTKGVKGEINYEISSDPLADIHWGMGKTFDFYKEVFSRNSHDGNGAPVYNYVFLPEEAVDGFLFCERNNASALSDEKPYPMVYGMGGWDGKKFAMLPVVEISVMSHEFTHIVTDQTAKLEYKGESGAINESFSDIMGISCKKYVEGNGSGWLIGGEGLMIGLNNMRDMAYPKNSQNGTAPCPDTYKGQHWKDTSDMETDLGGIHTNSGVQNKWYYLLTDGGSGTNDGGYAYNVTGIGIEKSRQIAYRTLTQYATKTSQYADIRKSHIQAATDLYGANSTEVTAVKQAWDAVGVYENGVMPTAIDAVQVSDVKGQTSAAYNLQGHQVDENTRGLIIHQGKVYLNK